MLYLRLKYPLTASIYLQTEVLGCLLNIPLFLFVRRRARDEVEHQMSLQVLPAIYTNERNPRRTVCAVKARERLDTEPYKNTPFDISKIK